MGRNSPSLKAHQPYLHQIGSKITHDTFSQHRSRDFFDRPFWFSFGFAVVRACLYCRHPLSMADYVRHNIARTFVAKRDPPHFP
jgi:hypothetical protein